MSALSIEQAKIWTIHVQIGPDSNTRFAEWQAKLHQLIAQSPGFISLEILSQTSPADWLIVQRFENSKSLEKWRQSESYHDLINELKTLATRELDGIKEGELDSKLLQGGITEVFVTQVDPKQNKAYQEWMAHIHQVEAGFPGFRGVYVQSPQANQGKNWITLLQFDTPENLDHWLTSVERQKVLKEAESFITSLESHRVISPYSGWFASLAKNGALPPVWKQTMVVLLILFPIVMGELKILSPWTVSLNPSLATFIGNAISVTLIAWPLMPIAIWLLGWWLSPKQVSYRSLLMGTSLVVLLYLLEIAIFWNFL